MGFSGPGVPGSAFNVNTFLIIYSSSVPVVPRGSGRMHNNQINSN